MEQITDILDSMIAAELERNFAFNTSLGWISKAKSNDDCDRITCHHESGVKVRYDTLYYKFSVEAPDKDTAIRAAIYVLGVFRLSGMPFKLLDASEIDARMILDGDSVFHFQYADLK